MSPVKGFPQQFSCLLKTFVGFFESFATCGNNAFLLKVNGMIFSSRNLAGSTLTFTAHVQRTVKRFVGNKKQRRLKKKMSEASEKM